MPRTRLLIVLVLFAIFTNACQKAKGEEVTLSPTPPLANRLGDTYPVDPLFQEFYASFGGEQVLGPAISPLIESGNLRMQYTEASLMVFDPLAVNSDRFRFDDLGLLLEVAEPPVPDPGLPGERFLNGHLIFEDFVPIYEQLGGAQFVGRPLTEVRDNPEQQRLEQYFENLGFYKLYQDPPGVVHLLAYGAYLCDQRCRYQAPSASIPALHTFLPEPFTAKVNTLGVEFTGRTLTEPYRGPDGRDEVILENMVLVIGQAIPVEEKEEFLPFRLWLPEVLLSGEDGLLARAQLNRQTWLPVIVMKLEKSVEESAVLTPQTWLPVVMRWGWVEQSPVSLKPIAQMVGVQVEPPVKRLDDPLYVFYPIEGDLGYNIPHFFNDYLLRHGGLEVSGKPIAEVAFLGDGVFRQCFANLCLEYDRKLPQAERLRLAALGVIYKEKFYLQADFNQGEWLQDVHLEIKERSPYVAPDAAQEIFVTLTKGGVPFEGQQVIVTQKRPDSVRHIYQLEPTDARGETSLELAPISAPNGTLIPYEVCLYTGEKERFCVKDHYLIWKNP